jgi:hypothetical protein
MVESLEMLGQEPWCWHPDQIAVMTDKQIVDHYYKPAEKRAEERKKDFPDTNNPSPKFVPETVRENAADGTKVYRPREDLPDHQPGNPPPADSPQFREWVLAQFIAMGQTRRQAEHTYEWQKTHPVV